MSNANTPFSDVNVIFFILILIQLFLWRSHKNKKDLFRLVNTVKGVHLKMFRVNVVTLQATYESSIVLFASLRVFNT